MLKVPIASVLYACLHILQFLLYAFARQEIKTTGDAEFSG